MNNILRRTTYIVNNIDETIHFYKNIIGLNLLWQSETILNGNMPIGKTGDKARFVAFNGTDPTIGMVAFMQLLEKNNKKLTSPKNNLEIGDSILVLGVENCEEIYARLKTYKCNIYKSPFDNSVTGREGNSIKMISMFAWDPNNIFLEINQRI